MTSPSPTNNSSSSNASSNEWKLRKPLPRTATNHVHNSESVIRRHTAVNNVNSLTQQRNKAIHQSNGSLHSDSHSSSSVSPAPSPSPRPNSIHHHHHNHHNHHNNHQQQQNHNAVTATTSNNNLISNNNSGLGKRWSSTGDFGGVGGTPLQGRWVLLLICECYVLKLWIFVLLTGVN